MAAPHERPLSHKQWDLGFIDNSELINEGTGTRSHKGSPSRQKRARLRKDKEDSTQRQQQSDQSKVHSRATVDADNEKALTDRRSASRYWLALNYQHAIGPGCCPGAVLLSLRQNWENCIPIATEAGGTHGPPSTPLTISPSSDSVPCAASATPGARRPPAPPPTCNSSVGGGAHPPAGRALLCAGDGGSTGRPLSGSKQKSTDRLCSTDHSTEASVVPTGAQLRSTPTHFVLSVRLGDEECVPLIGGCASGWTM